MADCIFPSARTSAELFEAFSFTGVVGEGQFGRVWRCVDRATGAPLACKQIRKAHLTQNELESLEREISAMESLHGHRHVLPLLGLYEDQKSVYILTELCDGGDIFSLIVQTGGIPERAAAMIFAQVADAVRWCHVHRIAHRDIKPENVLITTIATGGAPDSPDTLEARLADFGLAMEIPTGFSLRGAVGSAPYEAPEVLAGDLYSFGADVWSLGVLLYATISAKWPSFPRNVRKFLPEVDFSVAPWPSVSVEAKDLIRRMLTVDSSQRLDIDGVLAHPWLRIASAQAPKLDFGPETAAPHPHSPKLDSRPESSKARRNGCSSQSAADVDYSEATRIAGNSKASGSGVPRHASFDEWSECGAEGGRAEAGCADLSEPVLRAAEADQRSAEAASCGAASAAITCWATSPRRPWSQRSPTSGSPSDETRRDPSRSSGGGGSGSRTNSSNSSSSSSSSVRPVRLKREVPLGNNEQSHIPSAAVSRLSPKAPSPRRQFRQSASSQSLCSEGLPLQPTKLPPFHRASPSPLSCPPQGIPLQPSTPKAFPSFPQASPAAASPSPRSCPLQGIPLQPSTPRTPKASPSPRSKTRTGATAALPKGPSAHGSASDVSSAKPAGKPKATRSLAKRGNASWNERTLPSSSSTSSGSGSSGTGSRSSSGGRVRAWHRRSVSDVAHSPAADLAVPGLPTTLNLPLPDLYVSEHPGQHASGCPPCSRPPRIAIPTSPAMSDSYYDDADESECELTPTFCPQPAPEFPISSASSSARELPQQAGSPNNSVAKSRPKLPLMPAVTSLCSRYVRNLFTPASVTMASGPWQ
ncbi:unnamed protein product [Closterium sp. NIES-53]